MIGKITSEKIALLVALAISLFINIPQLYKIVKSHDVAGISVYTVCLRIACNACYILYAVLIKEWIFVVVGVQNILSEAYLLYLFRKHGK
tara:strand:+ start:345 stop:614 length:270 start_codon:yes stop_codon:yes gene_type:complete